MGEGMEVAQPSRDAISGGPVAHPPKPQ
jgi:hypothetical protein